MWLILTGKKKGLSMLLWSKAAYYLFKNIITHHGDIISRAKQNITQWRNSINIKYSTEEGYLELSSFIANKQHHNK